MITEVVCKVIARLPLVPQLNVLILNLISVKLMLNDCLLSKCNLKINGNPQYLLEFDGEDERFLRSNFEMRLNSAENLVKIVYQSCKDCMQ